MVLQKKDVLDDIRSIIEQEICQAQSWPPYDLLHSTRDSTEQKYKAKGGKKKLFFVLIALAAIAGKHGVHQACYPEEAKKSHPPEEGLKTPYLVFGQAQAGKANACENKA